MSQMIFCQSCAMPMSNEKDFGTEKDGSPSKEYCRYCYKKGKWTNADITFDEMVEIGRKGLDSNPDMGRFMKWMLKKTYPTQLKNLKRWKK